MNNSASLILRLLGPACVGIGFRRFHQCRHFPPSWLVSQIPPALDSASRMQSLPIVDLFQKLANAMSCALYILVVTSLYFLLIQRAHETARPARSRWTVTPAHTHSDFRALPASSYIRARHTA